MLLGRKRKAGVVDAGLAREDDVLSLQRVVPFDWERGVGAFSVGLCGQQSCATAGDASEAQTWLPADESVHDSWQPVILPMLVRDKEGACRGFSDVQRTCV